MSKREKIILPPRTFDAMLGIVWTFNAYFAHDRKQWLGPYQALDILNGGTIKVLIGPEGEEERAILYSKKRAENYLFHIKLPKKRIKTYEV